MIGLVIALVASALLLGMLLGANLLLSPAAAANLVQKEKAAVMNFVQKEKAAVKMARETLQDAVAKSLSHIHQKGKNTADDNTVHDNSNNNNNNNPVEAAAGDVNNNNKDEDDDTHKNGNPSHVPKEEKKKKKNTAQLDETNNNGRKNGGPYPYNLHDLVSPTMDFTHFTPLGGERFAEYHNGISPYIIDDAATKTASDELARSRRIHIKNAMKFAYNNYETYAFGHDEVLPQTKGYNDNWGGIGTTMIDSLDTLWLMDLKEEFWRARDWVRDTLEHHGSVSVFETTIRSLGGLLAAYDWSGDTAFLIKATDLGERLFKAFAAPSGIPFSQVDLTSGRGSYVGWTGGNAILSELGSLQLEFRYLAKATHRTEFATKSEAVFDMLSKMKGIHNGLYSYFIKAKSADQGPVFANDRLTFGAMSDSVYEYMLKVWLQGGKTEPLYRDMYDKAMTGMHEELLQQSTPSGLWYIADKNNGVLDHKMDHLVCFMGGLLALGAYTDPLGLTSDRAQRDLTTARALTYTCYQMYARMNTGISAEFVQFTPGNDFAIGRGAPHYLLRPEAVESFFILNQLTGDPIYREWGWEVFQALERYCKTDIAYGSLHNVADTDAAPENKMESFFLAETLKYLYLLQDPDTEIDVLNKHVFNTEAHPMRIFPVLDPAAAAAAK